ncbi:MAG: amidohydrolase family protein, partial [Halobacteriales archaeon]|nr:amidohydrolase family protein [Halobacteriales archaeon]
QRDHYYGLAALPNGAGGEAAARELERCLDNGWNGGAIETLTNGIKATDEEMEPVYEVASDAGAPLLIHPKIHDSLGPPILDDDYLLNSVFGREVALCETLCKLIHDGILDRHPGVTPVIHHTGGNFAPFVGRLRGKLEVDSSDRLKSYDEFMQQLRDRVYLDTSGYYGDTIAFQAAIDVFGASNMMLGSDFPYETRTGEDFEIIVDGIREVATPEEAERILGGNALDLMVNVD